MNAQCAVTVLCFDVSHILIIKIIIIISLVCHRCSIWQGQADEVSLQQK